MHLYIGNKLYSSWSLRPWLLMRALDIPFEETVVPLDTPEFKAQIGKVSEAGRVPVLVDGEVTVWESLAITEYLAERFPESGVWPTDQTARAHARSISSEMHAGFGGLRAACPMNFGKVFGSRDRGEELAADVQRIGALWREALENFGSKHDGPFLYGAFSAADAMYAPVVARFAGYGISVDPLCMAYMTAVIDHAAFQQWRREGLAEPWIVEADEVNEPALKNFRPHLNAGRS